MIDNEVITKKNNGQLKYCQIHCYAAHCFKTFFMLMKLAYCNPKERDGVIQRNRRRSIQIQCAIAEPQCRNKAGYHFMT